MSYIPNPFLQGSPDIRPNSPPVTPNSAPGFLMMTRPANDCNSVGKMQARRFRGTVRPNHSFNRHHTPHYPSPHDSPNRQSTPHYSSPHDYPNRHSTPRYSSPNHNHRGLNNRGNGNQRFNLSMDHVSSSLQHPYQSTGKANFYQDNNSFSGSPAFHSSPHQFRGQRGRSFGNRNSFSGSHNKSNSFHKTPLKDIPIDKFASESMFNDPWEDLNSSSEDRSVVLDEPNKNISLENSQIVIDSNQV